MTRFLAVALIVGLVVPSSLLAAEVDGQVAQAEARRAAVMAEARTKTVAVFPPNGQGGGSGVLITPDGYALSNFHVVRGAERHMKCGLSDGRAYDAVVVGIDPVGDVALIKLFGREDFPMAQLGDSDQVRVGDWVFCSGNPFLLAHDFTPSVSYGIVSGVHRYQYPAGTLLEYADCIQTDAAINPGNSGGPLFDDDGKLIGINGRGSFEKRGRVNVGVGYAISINQIKHFLGCLRSGRIVDHATLGATVASDADGRAVVTNVLEDSDVYRRGVRIGDEIVSFGGRPVLTTNAFKNVLGIFPQGYRVPLTFRSRGTTNSTQVRLAGVHNLEELLEKMRGEESPKKKMPLPELPEEPQPKSAPKAEKPAHQPKFPSPFEKKEFGGEKPQTPEIVVRHFKERTGYANYYFNELERSRVWQNLSARIDATASIGAWRIQGEQLAGGAAGAKTSVELLISDARVEYRLPSGTAALPIGNDLTTAVEPEGTGGLLAALSLWRRLVALGPAKFGDLTYLGTFPLPGSEAVYDVLLGRHGGVVCRYFTDTKSGDLACVEMQLDESLDPCELRFSAYREQNGRWLPDTIEVRHADTVYAVLHPQKWDFNVEGNP